MHDNVDKNNDYLEHYVKHNISPVRQNISDIKAHFLRRTALYRTLGLLPSSFTDKKVLEVGPGSGYNSLVVAAWSPSRYVLVEPNPTGVVHIKNLFREKSCESRIDLINMKIEEYSPNEQYDIILCEGMIPGLNNKELILTKLDALLKDDGVIVVTCADEISMFFEIIRYYFTHKLTKDIKEFKDKISVAVDAFGSHLDTLEGFSRLKEDWCADCLFGYAHFNYDFSLKKCIEFFMNKYYVYNTSPSIFSDYRWYKKLPHEPNLYNQFYIEQFDTKKHNLLHYQVIALDRTKQENEELLSLCMSAMNIIYDHVKYNSSDSEIKLFHLCDLLIKNLMRVDRRIVDALIEIQNILKSGIYTIDIISGGCKSFGSAFGRGQQYISLIKMKADER